MKFGNVNSESNGHVMGNEQKPRRLPSYGDKRLNQEYPQPQEKELHIAYLETFEPKRAVLLHLFQKLVRKHTNEGNTDIIEKLATFDFVDSEISEDAPNLAEKLKQHISAAFSINDDMVNSMLFQFRVETGYLIDPTFFINTVHEMFESLGIDTELDNELVGQLGIVLLARVALTTL